MLWTCRAFLLPIWLIQKRGNFKAKKFFGWVESFLYYLGSSLTRFSMIKYEINKNAPKRKKLTNSGYKYRLPRRVSFDVIQNAIPWKNGVEKWHPRTLKLVSRLLLKCRGMLLAFSSSFCGLTEHGTLWRPMVPSDAAYTHPSVSQNHGTDTCTTKSAKKEGKWECI